MSNKLLIIGVILVATTLIPLSFESLYNYSMYVALIKNVDLLETEPIAHVDAIPLDEDTRGPAPLEKFEYNKEDETLTVTFSGGHVNTIGKTITIPDFKYTQNFQINQTFAFRCIEFEDNTFVGFYKFLGVEKIRDEDHILLWHYEGETRNLMQCNYPEIIKNSIDLVDDHPTEKDMNFFYKTNESED